MVGEMPRTSPYSRFFQKPVVQKVKVPAMVRNGVYIPEHYEYVIVKPGEYVLSESPGADKDSGTDSRSRRGSDRDAVRENREGISIVEIKRKYGIPDSIKPVAAARGDYDCLVIPYGLEIDWTGDIVPVNLTKISDYLNEKSMKTPYIVSNDQQVTIEQSNYTFTCSSNRTEVTVQSHIDGRTVSIRVPDGGGILTRNGDVLKVSCL